MAFAIIQKFGGPPDTSVGDFAQAFADSPSSGGRHLHDSRSVARDDGAACPFSGGLGGWQALDGVNQMTLSRDVAKTLGISPKNVRLISPIGGGFGENSCARADALLAALGAKSDSAPSSLCSGAFDYQQYDASTCDGSTYPDRNHIGR